MDTYLWLQPAIAANYKLVGSQFHQCYPGHNPGYRPIPSSPSAVLSWLQTMRPGRYKDSVPWTQKLANKAVHVETYRAVRNVGRPPFAEFTWKRFL